MIEWMIEWFLESPIWQLFSFLHPYHEKVPLVTPYSESTVFIGIN